jgi:hypothetical protein
MCRPRAALTAENLFLKKQLALYLERQAKPRRADDETRVALVALSRLVDWRRLLTVVKPDALLRWHRTRLSAVLAMEVETTRTAAHSGGAAPTD